METINIEGTEDTPKIILDYNADVYEISGKSFPEDCATFYEPVMNWLESYSNNPKDKMIFKFKLDYFNTASSKSILDILLALEELDKKVHIEWHYRDGDEDLEDAGEEYADMVECSMELVKF